MTICFKPATIIQRPGMLPHGGSKRSSNGAHTGTWMKSIWPLRRNTLESYLVPCSNLQMHVLGETNPFPASCRHRSRHRLSSQRGLITWSTVSKEKNKRIHTSDNRIP